MGWVKKSRDNETNWSFIGQRLSDATATRHTWYIVWFGSGLTTASRRSILTLQQRVDVLKLLDAGHSFELSSVAIEVGCGKTQVGHIIAQPLISPTATWRWRSCYCHPTQCFLSCACMCVRDFHPYCTKCTHLFEINYHCICTQLLIYGVYLFHVA